MSLRSEQREIELLENKAAEKAGMRMLLLDEKRLFGKKSNDYINEFIALIELDIAAEVLQSAKLGMAFNEELIG